MLLKYYHYQCQHYWSSSLSLLFNNYIIVVVSIVFPMSNISPVSSHQHQHQQQPPTIMSQIYETFLRARQSNETYIQKAKLREKLYNILRKCFKTPIDLYIVGSSINNLGNNNSDVDMCLVISDRDIDQSTEALPILQFVRDQLRQYDFVCRSNLIMAKVPLLRFEDSTSAVVVDLNVNNTVGIRNTHLINCYTRRKYMQSHCVHYYFFSHLQKCCLRYRATNTYQFDHEQYYNMQSN